MGDIVGPIFVIISIALLSSWLLSLTIITLFCYLFLKDTPKYNRKPSIVDRVINTMKKYYKDYILLALAHKWKVFIGIFLLFFLSIYGFTILPFVFFPDSDRNMITVDIYQKGQKLNALLKLFMV
jgi:multidrug efflux pump subunit AcrB